VLARVAAEARHELRLAGVVPGPQAWRQALDDEVHRLIAPGHAAQAKNRLLGGLRAACA
jgi:hypothetical protein